MSLISKPNTFSPNTTASSSEVNDNFDTIYNDYNGGITGANLATGAVTTAKIADNAVTSAKIAAGTITTDDLDADLVKGWQPLGDTPDTVTNNGNRSYDLVFNGTDLTDTVSNGMRLRATRTVTAPTQCADLESGSTQYYSRATGSVTGMTFTDDFVVSAWVKLESYGNNTIVGRYNGTSGYVFDSTTTGQIRLIGFNAGGANFSQVLSYQSIPLNKWVHVAAQLDMSAFTATTTTSYVMIDGVDVPSAVSRGGTNPTALIQPASDLNIGAYGGGSSPFDGKLAQVAIFGQKVTQATMRTYMSQTLSGSETNLVSAYSLSNSIVDLNANANNLTANGGALATNADSPFGIQADGTTAGTTEYAIITKTAFSTNTTLTVQVPEGCALPTSGGISAVSYSTQKVPYGFVADIGRWQITTINRGTNINNGASTGDTYYNVGSFYMSVPIGTFRLRTNVSVQATMGSATHHGAGAGIGTSAGNSRNVATSTASYAGTTDVRGTAVMEAIVANTSATIYYINLGSVDQAATALYLVGASNDNTFTAELALL